MRQAGNSPKYRVSHLNFPKPHFFLKYFFLAYVLAKMSVRDLDVVLLGNTGFTQQQSTYNLDGAGINIQVHVLDLINIFWTHILQSKEPRTVIKLCYSSTSHAVEK